MSDVVPSATAGVTTRSRRGHASPRRLTLLAAVAALAVLTALSGCTSKSTGGTQSPVAGHSSGASPKSPTSSAPAKAVIVAQPASGRSVNPIKPVTVAVTGGRLTSVKLVNPTGKVVSGTLAADGSSWKNSEVLGYSKTYTISAVAVNAAGKTVTKHTSFTTLTPGNQVSPYMQRTGGYGMDNGATYGVGIVPVVHFDESITNKKAAEQALIVTTSPHVDGVWSWVDDQNAHWRPRTYFTPGTKVTVNAKVYGIEMGNGLYGSTSKSVSFTIGAKHLAVADDKTHTVKVYFNNKYQRTMPVSMGRGGYVKAPTRTVEFWTSSGTYTVLTHENPAVMSSASYGLPANAPGGYAPERIPYATKISVDGVYLHEMDTTVWAQGHVDVSHGCLNLNRDNAIWYYQHSQIGDVVQVVHTGGPALQQWQNGDWSVPWSTWLKGSALH